MILVQTDNYMAVVAGRAKVWHQSASSTWREVSPGIYRPITSATKISRWCYIWAFIHQTTSRRRRTHQWLLPGCTYRREWNESRHWSGWTITLYLIERQRAVPFSNADKRIIWMIFELYQCRIGSGAGLERIIRRRRYICSLNWALPHCKVALNAGISHVILFCLWASHNSG